MQRLSIDLSVEQHKRIKAMAVVQGKTIKDLVLGKIFDESADDDTAWQELLSFLDDRISEVEQGGISTKTPDQIAETVLLRHKNS
jgi:hypothetical protein